MKAPGSNSRHEIQVEIFDHHSMQDFGHCSMQYLVTLILLQQIQLIQLLLLFYHFSIFSSHLIHSFSALHLF